jgi:hypothetical protein
MEFAETILNTSIPKNLVGDVRIFSLMKRVELNCVKREMSVLIALLLVVSVAKTILITSLKNSMEMMHTADGLA